MNYIYMFVNILLYIYSKILYYYNVFKTFLGKYFTQKKKCKLNIDLNLFIISIFIIIVVFWYKIDEYFFYHTNPQLSVKSSLTIFQ